METPKDPQSTDKDGLTTPVQPKGGKNPAEKKTQEHTKTGKRAKKSKKKQRKNNPSNKNTTVKKKDKEKRKRTTQTPASDIRNFYQKKTPTVTKEEVTDEKPTSDKDKLQDNVPAKAPDGAPIIIKEEWNGNIPGPYESPSHTSPKNDSENEIKRQLFDDKEEYKELEDTSDEEQQDEVKTETENDDEESELTRAKKAQFEIPDSKEESDSPVESKQDEVGTKSESKEEHEFMTGEYDPDYDEDAILDDEEKEEASLSSEDSENTIKSEQTTVQMSKEELKKVRELPSTRYQFSFLIEDMTLAELKEEHEGKQTKNKDPATLIKRMLDILYAQLLYFDPQFKLLSWSSNHKKGPTYMKLGKSKAMPNNALFLKKYFDGLNLRRKSGRMYIRFRFHSTQQDKVYMDMKEWANAEGHRLSECVIQTENSTNIGWLVYSSQYTDTEYLKCLIMDELGFEVGFKLSAITNTDTWEDEEQKKLTEWKNRKKALSVHVDTECANAAVAGIAKLFEPISLSTQLTYNTTVKDKFLFTRPEYTIPREHCLKYKKLINRQSAHSKRLMADLNNDIIVDLDMIISSTAHNISKTTLRSLILNIRSTSSPQTYNMLLFQGIDFTPNSKEVWINGIKGQGGPAHIFSFYSIFEAEARMMIRGLGTFLSAYHGYRNIYKCFSEDHWNGTTNWKWDRKNNVFKTPEVRQIKANVIYDPNAKVMDIFEKEDIEEAEKEAKKKKELSNDAKAEIELKKFVQQKKPTKRSRDPVKKIGNLILPNDKGSELDTLDSREVAKKANEIRELRIREDDDMDSIDCPSQIVPEIQFGEMKDENDSAASSITMDEQSLEDFEDDIESLNQSKVAPRKPFESKSMKKIISKNLPFEDKQKELKKAMDIDIQNFINMRKQEYEQKLAKEHSSKQQQQVTTPTTTTPIPVPIPVQNEVNDTDSAATETTGNTIE